ncbi:GFA family protein [Microbulbifer sp. JMSA004]|uniref:GFA family protein n=1 Tax=Microbulbifer sp. JMSA004 TaxID=3243370 RepID=UPI004039DE6D
MSKISGECLCGYISYSCSEEPVMAGHCQCTDCQKISGAGHIANIAIPRGSLTISGDLAFHEKQTDSGNTVRRGFCPRCGSHIYAENSGMLQFEFIRAGSLHDLEQFNPTMVVYAGSGASWDYMDPELQKFEKMPEM